MAGSKPVCGAIDTDPSASRASLELVKLTGALPEQAINSSNKKQVNKGRIRGRYPVSRQPANRFQQETVMKSSRPNILVIQADQDIVDYRFPKE